MWYSSRKPAVTAHSSDRHDSATLTRIVDIGSAFSETTNAKWRAMVAYTPVSAGADDASEPPSLLRSGSWSRSAKSRRVCRLRAPAHTAYTTIAGGRQQATIATTMPAMRKPRRRGSLMRTGGSSLRCSSSSGTTGSTCNATTGSARQRVADSGVAVALTDSSRMSRPGSGSTHVSTSQSPVLVVADEAPSHRSVIDTAAVSRRPSLVAAAFSSTGSATICTTSPAADFADNFSALIRGLPITSHAYSLPVIVAVQPGAASYTVALCPAVISTTRGCWCSSR